MTRLHIIRREDTEPEHFVLLPLSAHAAAKVIRRHFDAAQVKELARILWWGREEEKPCSE